jgi:hypothetical protein
MQKSPLVEEPSSDEAREAKARAETKEYVEQRERLLADAAAAEEKQNRRELWLLGESAESQKEQESAEEESEERVVAWLEAPTLKRKDCEDAGNRWILENRIGQGNYGSVSRACLRERASDCGYAIKVSKIAAGEEEQKHDNATRAALKDIYFLRKLQDARTTTGQRMVPQVFDAWICKGLFYIVMAKYQGNLQELGEDRANAWRASQTVIDPNLHLWRFLFYASELEKLFRLTTEIPLLNGDAKPDGFVFRFSDEKNTIPPPFWAPAHEIVMIDLAMAGDRNLPAAQYGAISTVEEFECPPP